MTDTNTTYEAFTAFQEGSQLLASSNPHAAATVLERAVELDPVNDYAHFGLGLCLLRTGDQVGARAHLRLAVAMRPQPEYRDALARATDDAA
jgi:Flp pilus assembly protein TadD